MSDELITIIVQRHLEIPPADGKERMIIGQIYDTESSWCFSVPARCVQSMSEHTVPDDGGAPRKTYYGEPGKQPWDDMLRNGWAVNFAAGCVLKYLRRVKNTRARDLREARWYWTRLCEMVEDRDGPHYLSATHAKFALVGLLNDDELDMLREVTDVQPAL